MSSIRYLVTFICAAILLAFVGCCLALFGYRWLEKWSDLPVTLSNPQEITLSRGMPLKSFAEKLEAQGITDSARYFDWWIRTSSNYSSFQAGPYRFEGSVTPRQIAKIIQSGDVHIPVLYELAIPEGFTVQQIAERAESLGIASKQEVLNLAFSPDFARRMNIGATSVEGYLFPATYGLTEKLSAEALLTLLIETFFNRLPANYQTELSTKGLSLHQAVIFSSLIERETQQDSERELVSEVIWNRLNKGIALAIDASIIYGITDYDGNLRRRHLDDKANLYNTRVHRGLPPGPIASPGTLSLEAVLHPTSHGYYYYVVDADNLTHHRFSRTLREHNNNVAAYVRARKKR